MMIKGDDKQPEAKRISLSYNTSLFSFTGVSQYEAFNWGAVESCKLVYAE